MPSSSAADQSESGAPAGDRRCHRGAHRRQGRHARGPRARTRVSPRPSTVGRSMVCIACLRQALSVSPSRVGILTRCGLTQRQSRFLVHVLVFSGVFLERQYRAFTGLAHGQKTQDFLAKLVKARSMIITAVDTGMRRGEMLALRFADVDCKRQVIVLRGETTKSRKSRRCVRGPAERSTIDATHGAIWAVDGAGDGQRGWPAEIASNRMTRA